jgi:hypothetical protein
MLLATSAFAQVWAINPALPSRHLVRTAIAALATTARSIFVLGVGNIEPALDGFAVTLPTGIESLILSMSTCSGRLSPIVSPNIYYDWFIRHVYICGCRSNGLETFKAFPPSQKPTFTSDDAFEDDP